MWYFTYNLVKNNNNNNAINNSDNDIDKPLMISIIVVVIAINNSKSSSLSSSFFFIILFPCSIFFSLILHLFLILLPSHFSCSSSSSCSCSSASLFLSPPPPPQALKFQTKKAFSQRKLVKVYVAWNLNCIHTHSSCPSEYLLVHLFACPAESWTTTSKILSASRYFRFLSQGGCGQRVPDAEAAWLQLLKPDVPLRWADSS